MYKQWFSMAFRNSHLAAGSAWRQALYLLFLLSPCIAPYLIYPRFFAFYSIPAYALLLCLAHYYVLYDQGRRHLLVSINVFSLFILSLATIAISYFSHPYYTVYGNIEASLLLLVAYVTFIATTYSRPKIHNAYILYLIAACFWISIAVPVWLGWTGGKPLLIGEWALTTDPQYKISGPFTNGNVMAILLVIAWIFSVYFWITRRQGLLWWVVQLFFWIWIVASMSRGAWLAQSVVFLLVVAYLIRGKAYKQVAAIFVAGVLSIGLGSAIFSYAVLKQTQDTVSAADVENLHGLVPVGGQERMALWRIAWEMWKEHPIVGVGLGRFDANFFDAQAQVLAGGDDSLLSMSVVHDSAHNLFLHLLAELGLVGAVIWFSISWLLIRGVWRYRSRIKSRQWAALASALVLWIQGSFNITMTDPFPVLLFAFFLGIAYAPIAKQIGIKSVKSIVLPSKGFLVGVASLAIFTSVAAYNTAQSWLMFEKWSYMNMADPAKGKIAGKLVGRDDILPTLVTISVNEFTSIDNNHPVIAKLQPLIIKALSVQPSPMLYKQLYTSQLIQGDVMAACETAHFIEQQRWQNDSYDLFDKASCKRK